eukprot:162026-Chlamydomonas_euryale.AAC.2
MCSIAALVSPGSLHMDLKTCTCNLDVVVSRAARIQDALQEEYSISGSEVGASWRSSHIMTWDSWWRSSVLN